MWGTDWTRAVRLLTYEQGVEAFRVAESALGLRPGHADGWHRGPNLRLDAGRIIAGRATAPWGGGRRAGSGRR